MKIRQRGFELISLNQFMNDFNLDEKDYLELKLPTRSTSASAGYDIYAPYDFVIKPGEIMKIPTGIKAYMNDDEYLGIYVRSSSGFKYNVRMCNQVGIIDSDFYNNPGNEGNIHIALQNEGERDYIVKRGQAIAQGIFAKYLKVDGDTDSGIKRIGGLGSTTKEEKRI